MSGLSWFDNPIRREIADSSDFGPCDCCSANSRTVWGYLHRGDAAEAAYFVQWTLGQVDRHGANFDLIVGKWGTGTSRHDRSWSSILATDPSRHPCSSVKHSLAAKSSAHRSPVRHLNA